MKSGQRCGWVPTGVGEYQMLWVVLEEYLGGWILGKCGWVLDMCVCGRGGVLRYWMGEFGVNVLESVVGF